MSKGQIMRVRFYARNAISLTYVILEAAKVSQTVSTI